MADTGFAGLQGFLPWVTPQSVCHGTTESCSFTAL
jgi:hypothetical protein